jgi:transcriptional regulator GlxA family with amidase domain
MDVLLVVFDDVQSLDLTGPVEVFAAANASHGGDPTYRLTTASLTGAPVRSSSGLRLTPDTALERAAAPHTLIVPGGPGTRRPDPRLIERIRELSEGATRVVSVCSGAFLLAEAGLLAGRRATTHWAACDEFTERYPAVLLDPEPIFVRDGRFATSAGVTAGMDLANALVEEDLGRDTALAVARYLVMFLRRPANQAQFSTTLRAQAATRSPLRELQHWIAEHPDYDLTVDAMAARVQLSPRQFARTFAAETGVTPGKYVDRIRLEAARRMLEDTRAPLTTVARACGYGTTESLRRAFLRALHLSPVAYRQRFTDHISEVS